MIQIGLHKKYLISLTIVWFLVFYIISQGALQHFVICHRMDGTVAIEATNDGVTCRTNLYRYGHENLNNSLLLKNTSNGSHCNNCHDTHISNVIFNILSDINKTLQYLTLSNTSILSFFATPVENIAATLLLYNKLPSLYTNPIHLHNVVILI